MNSRNKREGVYLGKMWGKHDRGGTIYPCKTNRSVVSCMNSPDNRKSRKRQQLFLKRLDRECESEILDMIEHIQ